MDLREIAAAAQAHALVLRATRAAEKKRTWLEDLPDWTSGYLKKQMGWNALDERQRIRDDRLATWATCVLWGSDGVEKTTRQVLAPATRRCRA